MHDYLIDIIAQKKKEVAQLKREVAENPQHILQQLVNGHINTLPRPHFTQALSQPGISIIAEVKRRSPSKGILAQITDPVALAKTYYQGGAQAISVLTDPYAFQGSLTDLQHITSALVDTPCAVLRKDFIIDPLQIAQARRAGAHAVLLIVAVLQDQTAQLLHVSRQLGLSALVEVHNRSELDHAIDIGADIIGVNNRDLTHFTIDPMTAINLKNYIPKHVTTVAESGIHSAEEAKQYIEAGYDALLIGEALVKADNPAVLINSIRNAHASSCQN